VQIANAGFFLAGNSGYSVFGSGPVVPPFFGPDFADSTVSFTVYVNTDGNWADDPAFSAFVALDYNEGLNGGAVDTSSTYVYLYQLVNDDPTPPPGTEDDIDSFFVNFGHDPQSSVTGGGFIAESTLNDGTNLSALNPGLGVDGAAIDTPGDNAPSHVFAGTPTLVATGGSLSGTDSVEYGPGAGPFTLIEFNFDESGGAIAPGGRSNILYITSNFSPQWRPGTSNDTGATFGDIPVPNPEPQSMIMALGAMVCGIAVVVRANKRKGA
jgi:hypothetical protein